jgi:hypothetical protein
MMVRYPVHELGLCIDQHPTADITDYEPLSRPASAPPSSSSGFDLVSRASDFGSDSDGQYTSDGDVGTNWEEGMAGEDGEVFPHYGYYLLGAPGFDLDEFLAACERPLPETC